MLKYVSSAHLRRSAKANVQVKTFPGARVDDTKFYMSNQFWPVLQIMLYYTLERMI